LIAVYWLVPPYHPAELLVFLLLAIDFGQQLESASLSESSL
jgi:hypothetical protein